MQPDSFSQPAPMPQTPPEPLPWTPPAHWTEPYPTYRRKRFNARIVTGMVLVIVGLALAMIAVFSSWWGMSGTATVPGYSGSVPVTVDFYYGQFCEKFTVMGTGGGVCIQYVPGMEPVTNLFAATFFLALTGFIFAILALAALITSVYKPNARYALLTTGLLGSILLMVAPIYIYTALPGAFSGSGGGSGGIGGPVTDFFGHLTVSSSGTTLDVNYGGGLGWYLAFLAFPVLLAGTVISTAGIKPVRYPRPEWESPIVSGQPYTAFTPGEPVPPTTQASSPWEPNPPSQPIPTPKPESPPVGPPTPPDAPTADPKPKSPPENQPQ